MPLTNNFDTKEIHMSNANQDNKKVPHNTYIESYECDSKGTLFSQKISYLQDGSDKIEYFYNNKKVKTEIYKEDLIVKQYVYANYTGEILYVYDYEYDRGRVNKISRTLNDECYEVEYLYDFLDRIVQRRISLNAKLISIQSYEYDVRNRVVLYKDESRTIRVYFYGDNNRILTYSIEDKMNNVITYKNYFENDEYVETKKIVEGQETCLKDIKYVNILSLNKPRARVYDFDLVVKNLMLCKKQTSRKVNSSLIMDVKIEENTQNKVLPISIRKYLLYKQAINK